MSDEPGNGGASKGSAAPAANPRVNPSESTKPTDAVGRRIDLIRRISRSLVIALGLSVAAILIILWLTTRLQGDFATVFLILVVGMIGGFVGLQRRLKSLTIDDLTLLEGSWVYLVLSPLAGAVLALLLFVLFVSELLSGPLFPKFEAATSTDPGLASLINIDATGYQEYAKLLFWAFVAGYSEKFVTNIIGKFEGKAETEASK